MSSNVNAFSTWSLSTKITVFAGLAIAVAFVVGINLFR